MFNAKVLFDRIVLACLILNCTISAHIINTDGAMDHRKSAKTDRVNVCQLACLDKFLFNGEDELVNPFGNVIDQCIDRPDCYMCFDFCEILSDESRMIAKLMCTNVTCVRKNYFDSSVRSLAKF